MDVKSVAELKDLVSMFKGSEAAKETGVTQVDLSVVYYLIGKDRLISAIKKYRALTSMGLREAKDFVDQEVCRLAGTAE